jgi:carbonic anhydrase/acetyltransferase-like protein (isoleucine patch superfamily)
VQYFDIAESRPAGRTARSIIAAAGRTRVLSSSCVRIAPAAEFETADRGVAATGPRLRRNAAGSRHRVPARATARSLYNDGMTIRSFQGKLPVLGARAYVDEAALVIGDVVLGDDASLWPGAVVRGDVHHIRIGARSNVQDGTVIHVTHDGPYTPGGFPTLIGADVTIGHCAVVHACTIEDACLIGMQATVLDGVVVRRHGFVGAGALVSPGKVVGEGELWLGSPARRVRTLSDVEIEMLYYSATNYVRLKDQYLSEQT